MNIRAFFALPLQEVAVRRLADYADSLCGLDSGGEVLWIDGDHYHLTLCFLGDVTLKQVERLEHRARETLRGIAPFQLQIGSADYYQVNEMMAVLAAMTGEQPELQALHRLMMDTAQQADVQRIEQSFRPHITLGRLPATNSFEAPPEWPAFEQLSLVDSVVLYQSKPGTQGSLYTPLFEVPLLELE